MIFNNIRWFVILIEKKNVEYGTKVANTQLCYPNVQRYIIYAIYYRGVEQLVARRAHNPKVTGSSPVPATNLLKKEIIISPTLSVSKPNISGTLINLRPIVKEDAQGMFDGIADKEGMRLTGTKGTFTLERTEKRCASRLDAENRVDYAITLKDNPAYIGEVVLNQIKAEERSANFRIALRISIKAMVVKLPF